MSICIHRPETPAFWTSCTNCPCAREVAEEQITAERENESQGDE